MAVLDIPVGRGQWTITVRDDSLLPWPRHTTTALTDIRRTMQETLEHPLRFEAFRRALTPDDRIALLIDESLPQLTDLVVGILEYLASAGIGPQNVTAISPMGSHQLWINDLPDAFADLQTEVHQPADRNKLSYLATTSAGRRIFLNRTMVDADQTIVLCGRGYNALTGYSGGVAAIYPTLADADSQRAVVARLAPQHEPTDFWPVTDDAVDTCWLLGSPFFIQVIEGAGDTIQQLIAGFTDTTDDGAQALNQRWRSDQRTRPEVVVATLSGDPQRHDLAAIARAAACAAHIVQPKGTIILLSEAELELGEAINIMRRCDEPLEALKAIFQQKPTDSVAAGQWAWAAEQATIYLASEIRPDIAEEIFATPLHHPREVQQLLDKAERVLVIPDAHKSWVRFIG